MCGWYVGRTVLNGGKWKLGNPIKGMLRGRVTMDLLLVWKLVGAIVPLIEEARVAGMLMDVISRVGVLNVGTLMDGLLMDGMLIDGMLKEGCVGTPMEGTLLEGMLNDGLLTVEPPMEGTIFEGNPVFGVLPGGNPGVGILEVGVCPLGGVKAKPKDKDTHRRSLKSRSASHVTISVAAWGFCCIGTPELYGIAHHCSCRVKNPQAWDW